LAKLFAVISDAFAAFLSYSFTVPEEKVDIRQWRVTCFSLNFEVHFSEIKYFQKHIPS